MEVALADGTVLVLTRHRKSKHENYLGRDENKVQWYRALECGHPARNPRNRACHACHPPRFKKRKYSHYLGLDAEGRGWYLAQCGHRVQNPRTTVCQSCPSQRKGKPQTNRQYENAIGVAEDGRMRYMAKCGHASFSPRSKKCIDCRIKQATNYTRIGHKKAHQLIAEKVLGRKLKPNELVHHINMDKRDFRNCNLLICDKQYHAYLHSAMERKYGEMCNPPISKAKP